MHSIAVINTFSGGVCKHKLVKLDVVVDHGALGCRSGIKAGRERFLNRAFYWALLYLLTPLASTVNP